jgi:hypothetical protein
MLDFQVFSEPKTKIMNTSVPKKNKKKTKKNTEPLRQSL